MRMQPQVRGGFVLGVAALIAVSLLAAWSTRRWRSDIDWVVHTKNVIGNLERALSGLEGAETGQRGCVITGKESYLSDYEEGLRSVERPVVELHTLTQDNAIQRQRVDRMSPLISLKLRGMAQTIEVRDRDGIRAAEANIRTGRGKQEMDEFRTIVGEMRQTEETLLSQRLNRQSQTSSVAVWCSTLGTILALILVTGAWRNVEGSIKANEAAQAEIVRATHMKSAFLANVSHELRTPLNTIIGFAEVLGEELEGPLSERQKRFASLILQDSLHLLDLVNEVLDLSKIEAGHLKLRLESFEARSAVDEVITSIQLRCTAKTIKLTSDVIPVNLTADRVRFKQVLFNLLSNAVKFTPVSGAIHIWAGQRGEFVDVSVTDTGPGILQKDQQRVFDAFYQTELAAKGSSGGTGLGLAITRQLVEHHGGSIRLASNPGEGCSFTVSFPLRPQQDAADTFGSAHA